MRLPMVRWGCHGEVRLPEVRLPIVRLPMLRWGSQCSVRACVSGPGHRLLYGSSTWHCIMYSVQYKCSTVYSLQYKGSTVYSVQCTVYWVLPECNVYTHVYKTQSMDKPQCFRLEWYVIHLIWYNNELVFKKIFCSCGQRPWSTL